MEHAPGSAASLDEAERDVDEFIRENNGPSNVTQEARVRDDVLAFVAKLQQPGAPPRRFAIVTAGGTIAPLERQAIRWVTNWSTGQRGAASAEHLLRRGYSVVYFHKAETCLLPFARHFQNGAFLDDAAPTDGGLRFGGDRAAVLAAAVAEHQEHVALGGRLLRVPFNTAADYQLGMRTILRSLREGLDGAGSSMAQVLVYLVAAVSDFYVPVSLLPAEKLESRPEEDSMTLFFHKVPKTIARGLVGRRWGDGAFVTTFKLETDVEVLDAKVRKHAADLGNVRLIAANLYATCREEIRLYDNRDVGAPALLQKPADGELEDVLIAAVVGKHDEFVEGNWQ
jgi:phosphopantothenate-cysteine ligase